MKILFYTLGCKVNQAETGGMAELLARRGHRAAGPGEDPDAVVINTCAVTAEAGRKSRGAVRRLRKRYPGAVLGVCGCLSQTEDPPGEVDVWGGSARKAEFIERLEEAWRTGRGARLPLDFPALFEPLPTAPSDGHTRAFLKIQDGCDRRCAYCAVPGARGPGRSLPPGEALRAAEEAAGRCPELVLTGVEISSYRPSLAGLTRDICLALPGTRVRLGSLTPSAVTESFCGLLDSLPNLCPHFHLSVQSGCDDVLRAMGRPYGADGVRRAAQLLRARWDDPALCADVIAGFPGESEAQWEETLALLEEIGFASLHVFPYSRRAGTPAASLPGQLSQAARKERAASAAALARRMREDYLTRWVGRTVDVLFETWEDGKAAGHAPQYFPVTLPGGAALRGTVRAVRLAGLVGGGWRGEEAEGGG